MRQFIQRYRFACITAALPALLVSGCNRVAPSGESETMTLLREGSEKVCVADDVRQTLRDLIIPKAADLADSEIPIEKRIQAVAALNVSYEATTCQSFDTSVPKVVCDTTVRIGSANGDRKSSFRLDYTVSPSADNVATFVVSADADDARAFATALIGDEINDIAAKAYVAQQDQAFAQAKAQLLATVNETWLRGAWIDANASAENCGNGQAVWFEQGHVFEGLMGRGRWSLAKDRLHIVVGGVDRTGTIDVADPISFQVSWNDDSRFSLRRCTRAEVETLPETNDGEVAE